MLIFIRLLILFAPLIALVSGIMWYRARRAERRRTLGTQEIAKLFFDHFLRNHDNRNLTYQQMVLAWEHETEWRAHFVFDRVEKGQTKIRAVYPFPESYEWHTKFLKNCARYQTDLDNVIYGDLPTMETANHSLLLKDDLVVPAQNSLSEHPNIAYMTGFPVDAQVKVRK